MGSHLTLNSISRWSCCKQILVGWRVVPFAPITPRPSHPRSRKGAASSLRAQRCYIQLLQRRREKAVRPTYNCTALGQPPGHDPSFAIPTIIPLWGWVLVPGCPLAFLWDCQPCKLSTVLHVGTLPSPGRYLRYRLCKVRRQVLTRITRKCAGPHTQRTDRGIALPSTGRVVPGSLSTGRFVAEGATGRHLLFPNSDGLLISISPNVYTSMGQSPGHGCPWALANIPCCRLADKQPRRCLPAT